MKILIKNVLPKSIYIYFDKKIVFIIMVLHSLKEENQIKKKSMLQDFVTK